MQKLRENCLTTVILLIFQCFTLWNYENVHNLKTLELTTKKIKNWYQICRQFAETWANVFNIYLILYDLTVCFDKQ